MSNWYNKGGDKIFFPLYIMPGDSIFIDGKEVLVFKRKMVIKDETILTFLLSEGKDV